MDKTIRIECVGVAKEELENFHDLQGELKTLPESEYEALKSEMVKEGFSFPLNVWPKDGKFWLIDGHQRARVLRRLKLEGWTIPQLPYCLVQAESYEQAKVKLLAGASSYGKPQDIGLANFLKTVQIDPIRLASNFPLAGINMPKFIEVHLPKVQAAQASSDAGDVGAMGPVVGSQIPAGQAAASVNHVRMVQLFFDEATFPQFMDMVNALQEFFNKENVSETMLGVVRESYSAHYPFK